MILSREQVARIKNCIYYFGCEAEIQWSDNCDDCCNDNIKVSDLIDTIEHLYAEVDRRELAHEKARHEVEVERDRLKAFKPYCFVGKEKCTDSAPDIACKMCHWREVEAE